MNSEKYRESNLLIAQRKGLPRLIQQQVIVSDEDIRLAKLCILNLKQQIQNYSSNNNPVWIPFLEILAEALPAEKGPDNRITKRIFSFLEIIVLAKSHLRKKLILGSETQAIAALVDLSQVLYITQNVSGMPSYKLKFFKDYFVPLVESKPEVNSETDSKGNVIKEKIIGVTTRELCERYKQETGKSITTDAMKKIYLNELLNNGYIDEEDSVIDKRQKIYRHIVDIPVSDHEKISNYTNPDQFDNSMQHSKLILPKNFKEIPENWLKLEILGFLKYRIDPPVLSIVDENNNELCLCKFIEEYEKHTSLIRYFSRLKFAEYHSKLFSVRNAKGTKEIQIAVFNVDSKYYCISNKCQHQGGPLSKGILDEEKKVITCPWHGWKYSIINGKAPHKGGDSVDSYETKIMKDKLYVNVIPTNIGSRVTQPHKEYSDLENSVRDYLNHMEKDLL
jgi:nitrite reductase/ring-hydroxylating ferredoxin subunit